jgi:nicotinamidase-related amidase
MIGFRNARRLPLLAVCAAATLLLCGIQATRAENIIDSWKSIAVPPPPQLQAVTVDSARTALLILDMYATTCIDSQRPRCAASIPRIQHLLAEARARKMLVVYSTGPPTSAAPPKPVEALAPLPGEPTVRTGADKWLGSDLEKILTAAGIRSVITVGTSAEGAVLYTASGAALRNLSAIVPVDGMSSVNPFAELYTAWHLKNAPSTISSHVTLTSIDQITLR